MSSESVDSRLREFFELFGDDSDRRSQEKNRISLARVHGLAVSGGTE